MKLTHTATDSDAGWGLADSSRSKRAASECFFQRETVARFVTFLYLWGTAQIIWAFCIAENLSTWERPHVRHTWVNCSCILIRLQFIVLYGEVCCILYDHTVFGVTRLMSRLLGGITSVSGL